MKWNFHHECVSHLAWALLSPSLIQPIQAENHTVANFSCQDQDSLMDWLRQLDQQPTLLTEYLAQQNSRLLGSYFECLWQFYFKHHPKWTLIDHHIQIHQNKTTLGELDILAQASPQPPLHLELAVKFYLRHPHQDGSQAQHWLGPQSKDRLDKKLHTLCHKQLPFLYHPATIQYLKELKLKPSQLQQSLAIKGYLFSPLGQNTQLPSMTNPKCLQGSWLPHTQLAQLLNHHAHIKNWCIAEKRNWLGPYTADAEQLLSKEALSQFVDAHFHQAQHKYSLMLLAMVPRDRHWVEEKRFMLVSQDWPNI